LHACKEAWTRRKTAMKIGIMLLSSREFSLRWLGPGKSDEARSFAAAGIGHLHA